MPFDAVRLGRLREKPSKNLAVCIKEEMCEMQHTPTQLLLAGQRRARLARIAAAARALISPPSPPPPPLEADEIPNFLPPKPRIERVNRVDVIIDCVADHLGVPRNEILSGRRLGPTVHARQIAYYLARTMTNLSHARIGRLLGGRYHSTVLHGSRRVQALIDCGDMRTIADIESIANMIEGGAQNV